MYIKSIIFTFFILIIPSSAEGALFTKENFNSLALSPLHENSGGIGWVTPWSASSLFEIVQMGMISGSKVVMATVGPNSEEPDAFRTFAQVTKGRLHFEMGKSDVSNTANVIVQSGDIMAMVISIGSDAQQGRYWFIREGNTEHAIMPYELGTLGSVDVEFNLIKNQYRASVNGGPYTNWYNLVNPVSSVDTLRLHGARAGGNDSILYWDTIKIKNN